MYSKNAPKVSVLLPAYNAEKYIAEAIQSILDQTFTDFEFIIINDGSKDNTVKIIRQFVDPRIIFIDNEQNSGLIAALNQGLDLARGEYIARMDADDISLPTRFAKQVAFMDANQDVGVLGSWVQWFGDDCGERVLRRDSAVGFFEVLRDCPVAHPTVMLRKSVFDKYDLRYDSDYVNCEDYELWSRAIYYTKIVNLPEILLKYRRHDLNHDSSLSAIQKDVRHRDIERIKQNAINRICIKEEDRKLLRWCAGIDKATWVIYLFGFVPFLKIESNGQTIRVKLFHIIPLIRIKRHKISLFNFIPVAKIRV
ncbi:hypothetical protein FACS1894205_5940 [Alphaproteobacteria bacterium]|nr:hypothetical protein FACS1894205_5940 [Alphaproteobacteria bacterium]